METAMYSTQEKKPPIVTQLNNRISDYDGLYEYLLLLSPYGFVNERIITEKLDFTNVYGNYDAARSLPHITLANFILSLNGQDNIICPLEIIAGKSNRIKVVLENYKWFRDHTIFIDVKYKVDIKQLVRKITKAIRPHIKVDNKISPHFISFPHLTLCKGLNREQYKRSVIEYSELRFHDEFIANEMILLRRSVMEGGNYQKIAKFKFGGDVTCDTTMQLPLFQ